MNRIAKETERRLRARDGGIVEMVNHIRRLQVECGLLAAAGDQMRAEIRHCSDAECGDAFCVVARQWDQVRSKGGEASADSPLSDRHPGGSGR